MTNEFITSFLRRALQRDELEAVVYLGCVVQSIAPSAFDRELTIAVRDAAVTHIERLGEGARQKEGQIKLLQAEVEEVEAQMAKAKGLIQFSIAVLKEGESGA